MTAQRRRRTLLALVLALPVVLLAATSVGSVPLSPLAVVRALLGDASALDPAPTAILWTLRLPRVLIAALVGGGLAAVGATLQSVFRNPLADSGLLGVGSGAALGAVLAVYLGLTGEQFLSLPLFAFAGALAAVLAVSVLARATGRSSVAGLVLTGLAVSAVAGAGTSVLLVATEEFRVKAVMFWLAGGLEGRGWEHLRVGAPLVLGGALALLAGGRVTDVLALGEDEAASLGLRVDVVRFGLLALSALVAGAATAVAGFVPFVGLIVPHALRPLVGTKSRDLLPATFLGGALLVVIADAGARSVTRIDLPLGALTALVGAPYFLVALGGQDER